MRSAPDSTPTYAPDSFRPPAIALDSGGVLALGIGAAADFFCAAKAAEGASPRTVEWYRMILIRAVHRFGEARSVDAIPAAILAVTDEPQSTRAWAIGARGEEKLAKALAGIDGLRVLHDRRVPRTRGNIDHIVIAPAGVFVVDAKHYQGKIEIRNRGWFLRPDHRLYVGQRDCSSLAAGLGWQVEAVAAALATAGVDPLPPVTPVLCFVDGEWPLFSPPDAYAGVRLGGTKSIRKILVATEVLDPPAIERLARLLSVALPAK